MQTVVELEGIHGEMFTLAGPNEGDRGVYLGTDMEGLYDPPVQVVYEEPGNFPGARYLWHRILRRDIVFGVEILNDPTASWMNRDSEWRKAWAYDQTCKLYVTRETGRRYLKLALSESIGVNMATDPNNNPINRADMTCVAGDPFWYEDDVTFETWTETDTTDGSVEDLTIDVNTGNSLGLNPTDQYIFPMWLASAPAKWTIPDYSFEDPALADRRIIMPELFDGEDIEIDTDPRNRQIVADNDAPVWQRMNGVRYRHPIPPYTEQATFNISVTKAPAGSLIQLRLPRPWSRPWGLL